MLPTGDWQVTGGSGHSSGSDNSQWSYDGNGSYWPSIDSKTVSGNFQENGFESFFVSYDTAATLDVNTGDWEVAGLGSITEADSSGFSYEGGGSYSTAAGVGTQEEDGHEDYSCFSSLSFELDSGEWHVCEEEGDGATSSRDWHNSWSYSVASTSSNGSETVKKTESSGQFYSGGHSLYYELDQDNAWRLVTGDDDKTSMSGGAGNFYTHWSEKTDRPYYDEGGNWFVSGDSHEEKNIDTYGHYTASATFSGGGVAYDGTGSVTDKTSSSISYSGDGTYSVAEGNGPAHASGSDSASLKNITNYTLDAEGHWQLGSLRLESSGDGFTEWSHNVDNLTYSPDSRIDASSTHRHPFGRRW